MTIRLLVCALLLAAAGTAAAQQPAAPRPATTAAKAPTQQLTPEQLAAIRKQNQVLVKYAESIVAMIDNGQIGQVWDQSSEVARKATPRDRFIQSTKADRERLGKVTSRKLARVTRSLSRGEGKLPAGYYINVNFATQFARHDKPVRELISFHLDSDKKWRMSGYTLPQPAAPAPAAR